MNFLDEPKHCQFCNKEMRRMHPRNNSYNCYHGEIDGTALNLSYHWDQNLELTDLTFIFGERGSPWVYYHIHLFYKSNKTLLTYFGKDVHNPEIMVDLDHLIDISPENAQQHLNRFKKLRVYL